MIEFKCVRWKNFLSTGNAWTEMDLNNGGSTLIVGENGSGKSTFLDAICFGLFAKPFRKVNKGQLVNTVNNSGCAVEVEFYSNNKHYKIVRTIKATNNTGGIFEIYENGKLLDQAAAKKDTQDFLERNILKLNYNSFTQIVILGSSTFVPFMQLSAGRRREVIEDLLDIRIFTAMNVLLKEKISENKQAISDCKRDVELQQEKLKVHNKYVEELKESNLEKINELNENIRNYEEQIEKHKREYEENQKRIDELYSKIEKDKSSKQISELKVIEDKLDKKKRKTVKEIDFYESSNTCPTCQQDIDNRFKEDKLEKKKQMEEELQKGLTLLDKKMNELQTTNQKVTKINSEIEDLNSKNIDHNSEIRSLNNYISRLNEEIVKIQSKTGDIEEENKTIINLKEKIKSLNNKKKELIDQRSTLSVASDMLKDKGIKTQIIKQYVPIINQLVNKYLASLDFFVNFELDENFNETIKSRYRDEFSYESFSEGEKARIDLSLLFAWRAIAKMKNSASTNLLILDEVFDGSLDGTGCDEVTKILSTIEDDTNVFVISHKTDQMMHKFTNIVKFEKNKNFSRMITE